MTVATGPLVYLTDGAPQSLGLFPQVAGFASAIGGRAMVARVQRSVDETETPDPRFAAALAKLAVNGAAPAVVAVPRRGLGTGIAAHAELRDGMLALHPKRHGGLSRMVFGNTYERLLRETHMPLFVLPADGRVRTVGRVLFPADLSPRSVEAFRKTLELCATLGARLDILHVYGNDRLLESEMDMERRHAAQSPRELLNIHREGITALLDQARAAGVHATETSAEGRAHVQILGHAAHHPIDLIVMATHGPRNAEDVVRGSTTIRVIHRATVPVLVFRA